MNMILSDFRFSYMVDTEMTDMSIHISQCRFFLEIGDSFPHKMERIADDILANLGIGDEMKCIIIETRVVFFEESCKLSFQEY